MKAMILAAGLGTRLKPFTDKHPKALVPVNGKTLLQRNVEYLQQFDIKEIIVNVHHFADEIIETIELNKGWGSSVSVSDEHDAVLETGGGLKKAAWFFEDETNFILMNADVLTNLDLNALINFHQQQQLLATLATTNRSTSRYFLFDEKNILCGWRNIKTGEEKPASSKASKLLQQRAFSGIHVISAKIFPLLPQGKFSMVDAYLQLMQQHKILSYDHSGDRFTDVGKPQSIAEAEQLFA